MSESPISEELLAILVCPESKLPVSPASDETLLRLNTLIENGTLSNRAGKKLTKKIEAGLVRSDSKVLYPLVDGIPVMLVEESIKIEN